MCARFAGLRAGPLCAGGGHEERPVGDRSAIVHVRPRFTRECRWNMRPRVTAFTRRRMVALGMSTLALPSSLHAQAAWPTGPVTFVVGYAPGGSNDINARELAHLMSPILGQQIVVDNKGSGNHLSGALFAEAAGIQLTHVPYKGTGPALADVISGIITMNFSSLPPAVPQVKAGNLKALAVTGNRRLTSLPDVPTLKEQGIDTVINGWHGLFAPASTPDVLLHNIARNAKPAMMEPQWA